MKKRWVKFISIGLAVALIAALVFTLLPDGKMSIGGEGQLSLETRIALAAQTGVMGNGEPVPQQIATFSMGGPPVVSITYNFDAVLDTDDVLIIDNTELSDVYCTKAKVKEKAKTKVKGGTTEYDATALKNDIQANYEIWTLLSDFPPDDPVRNEILLKNERVEKKVGKDYLVTTLAYFDIHIYSLEPLRFTTRINGLDAGPITGEWWQ